MKVLNVTKSIFLLICFLLISSAVLSEEAYAFRFFQQPNTWYGKIPANPELSPRSTTLIGGFNSYAWNLSVSPTINLYKADGTSVVKTVNMITEGSSNGTSATLYGWNKIPLRPTDVSFNNAERCTNPRTDQNNDDHKIVIISQDGTKIWDMHHAYTCDNGATWYASLVRMYRNSEDGVASTVTKDGFMACRLQQNGTYASDGYGAASTGKWPRIDDLLTYDEVANNTIDHALAFSFQWYNPGEGLYAPGGTYPSCNGSYKGGSGRWQE